MQATEALAIPVLTSELLTGIKKEQKNWTEKQGKC